MTAFYNLRVKRSAEKELRSAPRVDLARIIRRIQALAADPRPPGCEKLSGEEKYRVRQGDWRVVYSIDDPRRLVLVVKRAHRREAYR